MKYANLSAALLAASLGLAGPTLAQEAAEPAERPASVRTVSPRDLMTRQERADFRAEMERATPEQREALWARKRSELEARAEARGVRMAEPGRGPGRAENGGREAKEAAPARRGPAAHGG